MRKILPTTIAPIVFSWFVASGSAAGSDPQWMWAPGERMAPGDAEMRRSFVIDSLPDGEIQLRVLGDFCGFEVLLNGASLVRREPYDPVHQVSVKRWLRAGENQIVVKAEGVDGPSAVALDLARKNGDAIVASGSAWQGAVAISSLGEWRLGDAGLLSIGALDEYNQWKEAKGGTAKFSPLPEGFKLERLRAAKPDEGSWISMAFDPQGRLVISKEKRGLLRLDLAGDGEFEMVEDTLLECRGLLFAHGSLYANANNSKGLYRLRDTSGDDRFDEVKLLMKTEGGVGHGRNDLALGPGEMIYSIHGDSVKLPNDSLPTRRDPGNPEERGYLIQIRGKEGVEELDERSVLRDRKVISVGLRNPYGIAFNSDVEAFTYDADNEGDIGLPLYRPARVNHLVSGANYGWLQGRGESWPVYTPESLPTSFDAGRGSPTAVEFGTNSNFPPRYRDALFILDWAYGRIIAVDVIPNGASYRCQAETFLRGRPLNVTDLAFGSDGAMYFITGGRGTQSALYKVSYDGAEIAAVNPLAQDKARGEYSQQARELRRSLEKFHGKAAPTVLESSWPHLSSADPWIRNAARVALEWQPAEKWQDRVKQEANLTALLVLARAGREVTQDARAFDFASLSRYEKLCVLRILELGIDKNPELTRVHLSPLFPDGDPAVDRELSKLLVALGDDAVVGKSLAKLAAADSQFERLHYLNAVSRAQNGWTPDGRRAFFSAIQHPVYFRGDRNLPGYLNQIRQRAIATLGDKERAALGALLQPAADQSPLPKPRPLVQHWKVADLAADPPAGYVPDPQLGRAVFKRALCSRCHQAGGIGTPVGPNLTAVAARFNRRDLVEAIVEPSRAMAEIFRNLIIKKKDGSTVVGRVVRDDFRESTISISSNPFAPADLTVIAKQDIASHEPSPASPMPPGLLDAFSKDEIFQLLDFLANAGE